MTTMTLCFYLLLYGFPQALFDKVIIYSLFSFKNLQYSGEILYKVY